MLKSFLLTLMMGPGVPVPVPQPVLDALTGVQVTGGGERGGFQLTFAAGKNSPLITALLPAGYFDPRVRVIIVVTLGGIPNVLMDGIVTRQELSPSSEPGQSTLTITGEDLSVEMDIMEKPFNRWYAMSAAGRVVAMLAEYAVLGIKPIVVPPAFLDVPTPSSQIPTQTGTDFEYIRLLGSQNGHIFFIEPGPVPGSSVAYWGPDFRNPVPQPALNVNMDAETNVESLSFSLNGLARKILVFNIFDEETRRVTQPVSVPNISMLRPLLGARLTVPMRVEFSNVAANLNVARAAALALARLNDSSETISGSGQLDVLRYGRILKARQLVGVRGAGIAYDGLYNVKSVTHNIKVGEYKQSFNLSRDGLISQTPSVLP